MPPMVAKTTPSLTSLTNNFSNGDSIGVDMSGLSHEGLSATHQGLEALERRLRGEWFAHRFPDPFRLVGLCIEILHYRIHHGTSLRIHQALPIFGCGC